MDNFNKSFCKDLSKYAVLCGFSSTETHFTAINTNTLFENAKRNCKVVEHCHVDYSKR